MAEFYFSALLKRTQEENYCLGERNCHVYQISEMVMFQLAKLKVHPKARHERLYIGCRLNLGCYVAFKLHLVGAWEASKIQVPVLCLSYDNWT